ncbi:hypothetical protein PRZ48_011548 [Zasmidium cellare]|uniref:Uncharacterized protein n=1 Tax=Zasmidium cellare TaxID=395010 RepID=A0ABR0E7N1_ZASCE|nr:hypothetical protein PRZ48_011548 [Zasmidium cellare]
MILAAYRNPPYRSPTPRANNNGNHPPPNASQPPLDRRSQSPKRKRDEQHPPPPPSSSAPPAMLSSTAVVDVVPDSPRTRVAERFRGLEIEGSPRKRVRVDESEIEATPMVEGRELEIPESVEVTREGEVEVEMGSPSPTPVPAPTNPRRTFAKVPSLRKESSYLSTRASPPTTSSPPQKRRLSSPPAPTPSLETMALEPPSSLTWSLSEITGHDIDTTNPDDDGEGINGIGFKPTPAMAAARSLKRKKQVEEWKSREAREARQRRIEGRRKREEGLVGVGGGGGEGRRVVRFVDA